MVARGYYPSTLQARVTQAGRSRGVQGQPGPRSKFQASEDYIVRQSQKRKTKQKTTNQQNAQWLTYFYIWCYKRNDSETVFNFLNICNLSRRQDLGGHGFSTPFPRWAFGLKGEATCWLTKCTNEQPLIIAQRWCDTHKPNWQKADTPCLAFNPKLPNASGGMPGIYLMISVCFLARQGLQTMAPGRRVWEHSPD